MYICSGSLLVHARRGEGPVGQRLKIVLNQVLLDGRYMHTC
jgi:hypothetical protein